MAQLTTQQFIAKLREQQKQLYKPLAIAAQSVHADRMFRIFDTGTVARGYDKTQELWVADDKLRKQGSHIGKTGKRIKTTYFKSYYDLKQKQGFDPNEVNFRLTNDLQSDLANSQKTNSTALNVGQVIKVSNRLYQEALRRPKNAEKLEGLESRFGPFTKFTQAERKKFNDIIEFEMRKLLT
jgi:hypothetical protein